MSDIDDVATEARKTFMSIRDLRKTMPTRTTTNRKELDEAIKKEQDMWWDMVKDRMKKRPGIDPPFTKEYCN